MFNLKRAKKEQKCTFFFKTLNSFQTLCIDNKLEILNFRPFFAMYKSNTLARNTSEFSRLWQWDPDGYHMFNEMNFKIDSF